MIALASDHGGYELKVLILQNFQNLNISCKDFGCFDNQPCDYPDFAEKACNAIIKKECDRAILFCGTGIGMSIAANKFPGIRAACCQDVFSSMHSRMHNNANVICLGGRIISPKLAIEVVSTFINTDFEGGRHKKRISKINEIEKNYKDI